MLKEVVMPITSRNRVSEHTDSDVNRRIRQSIENNIQYYMRHKREIPQRLRELEEEWDIERAIQANAATLAFTGTVFGAFKTRWLLLPLFVTGFLLQHAVQGWCPPIPILRRLGFRTAYEIEQERQALKLIRGDYLKVASGDATSSEITQSVAA
jgi:hypothetical protein